MNTEQQITLEVDELARALVRRTGELETANAELRRQSQERQAAERHLRHAQKMEAIGQLAAGVAHDFNNILTIIHGHASMLLMRLGQEGPHAKSVGEIRRCAERAANLVRQLQLFSRKQDFQFRDVDLADVVRSMSGMLHKLLGEHVALETDCPALLPAIYADRGAVEQTIVNLAINARDAMPRGGKFVLSASIEVLDDQTAKSHADARAGRFVCLVAADTGCGMDTETLSHLFEPFYTRKQPGERSGLGLATVYGIVKQHQGWIEVRTEENRGTTFKVFFPVSAPTQPGGVDKQSEISCVGGSETILVAEDEPVLRDTVTDLLRLRGYRVLAAGSGPEALELAQKAPGRIDLLLTDLVMPGGMMGTDLGRELARTNPQLKILFTTGYGSSPTDPADFFKEGVNFLPKPYVPDQLAELVRRKLDAPTL